MYKCNYPVVHHIVEREEDPSLVYDLDNLITVTKESHEEIHRLYLFDKEKADLSNMTKEKNTYIGTASHSATIEFSNEGIKAAAVTQIGGLGDAVCGFEHKYKVPVKEINLTFNKPYLYLIRDKSTGEVWFVGTVYEPIENIK